MAGLFLLQLVGFFPSMQIFSRPLYSGHLSKKNLETKFSESSVGKKTLVLDYILMFALTL